MVIKKKKTMKKLLFFLAATLLCTLTACDPTNNGGGTEPTLKPYQGDWYMVRNIYDFHVEVPAVKYDNTYHVDTTYLETDTLHKVTLAADEKLLVDDEEFGTYAYDELEGTLTVKSKLLNDLFYDDAVKQDSTAISGVPFDITSFFPDMSTLVMQANYTKDQAKATYDYQTSGTVLIFNYACSFNLQIYFKR